MGMELTGKIKYVRFHHSANGFVVMDVDCEGIERPVLMTGYMPSISELHRYTFTGEFSTHPRYGYQFQFSNYKQLALNDTSALITYLSSDLFKGIGPVFAREIITTLGEDALKKIADDPNVLDHVKGMTAEKKETIASVIQGDNEKQQEIQFLVGHGLSLKQTLKIIDLFEGELLTEVQENPYCLVKIEGIGMKVCETIASHLDFPLTHPYSKKAHLLFEIKNSCMSEGSTYLELNDVMKLPYFDTETLNQLVSDGDIVLVDMRYYPSALYYAEHNISNRLQNYLNQAMNDDYDYEDVMEILESLMEAWAITYDEAQEEAIFTFLENDLMILSGGPGTGKTTIVKAMLAIYQRLYPKAKIALVAPTGRASKRLEEACEVSASTIHRLLKWDAYRGVFNVDSNDPLDLDLVIVDEFSMVDTLLFSRLLDGCINVKKLLLIGDEAQLPSIAPGQVLKDLIATKTIPMVFLKKIFRQKEDSGIIQIAHQIRNDTFNDVQLLNQYRDLHFLECKQNQIMYLIKRIVSKAVKDGYDVFDFQVLYPKYQGLIGIDAINRELQALLNPFDKDKKEIKFFNQIFREQDKVLQLKNRVDDHVFNGDLGTIIEIQKKDGVYYTQDKIIVDFEGEIVTYTSDCFNELTLAYCMSIHKAQGSEFKIVIIPFSENEQFMLNKNLIYTAISRAKQSLYMLGSQTIFTQGLKLQSATRKTGLQNFFNHVALTPYDFL